MILQTYIIEGRFFILSVINSRVIISPDAIYMTARLTIWRTDETAPGNGAGGACYD